jgi:hypothetical protein
MTGRHAACQRLPFDRPHGRGRRVTMAKPVRLAEDALNIWLWTVGPGFTAPESGV